MFDLLMVLDEVRSQAETYVDRFDGEPPLSQREINETLEGEDASRKDVYDAADELMDFYDDLLDRDTSDVRDEFKDDILYDMSAKEMISPRLDKQSAKIFGSGLAAPAAFAVYEPSMAGEALAASLMVCEYFNTKGTVSNAEAGYNPFSEKIGVSKDTLPKREAYDTLASELFHRHQHHFGSDTWMEVNRSNDVPPLTEGLERASKIRALSHFSDEEFQGLDWEELYDKRAASTLVNGYAQALSEVSDLEEQDLVDIGLSEEKAGEAIDNVGSGESKGYDLLAASLLVQEGLEGDRVYRDTFDGDLRYVPEFVEV